MRSAYGLSDLIGKAGSQESLALKSSDHKGQAMEVVTVVISQHLHDVDLKDAGRTLLMRKMQSTS